MSFVNNEQGDIESREFFDPVSNAFHSNDHCEGNGQLWTATRIEKGDVQLTNIDITPFESLHRSLALLFASFANCDIKIAPLRKKGNLTGSVFALANEHRENRLTVWNSLSQLLRTEAGQAMRQVGPRSEGESTPSSSSLIAFLRLSTSNLLYPFLPTRLKK